MQHERDGGLRDRSVSPLTDMLNQMKTRTNITDRDGKTSRPKFKSNILFEPPSEAPKNPKATPFFKKMVKQDRGRTEIISKKNEVPEFILHKCNKIGLDASQSNSVALGFSKTLADDDLPNSPFTIALMMKQ